DVMLWERGRFRLEGRGQAGVYYNRAESYADAIFPGFGTNTRLRDRDDALAFLGEIQLNGVIALSNAWSVVAGYRLIWLEGVATAPNQIANTTDIENLTVPQRTVTDTNGNALLHGLQVSLQKTF
ncbi:MAG: BBP7 family outer membrane beta-barrel protein, partial [Planctomycetales bacterium]